MLSIVPRSRKKMTVMFKLSKILISHFSQYVKTSQVLFYRFFIFFIKLYKISSFVHLPNKKHYDSYPNNNYT